MPMNTADHSTPPPLPRFAPWLSLCVIAGMVGGTVMFNTGMGTPASWAGLALYLAGFATAFVLPARLVSRRTGVPRRTVENLLEAVESAPDLQQLIRKRAIRALLLGVAPFPVALPLLIATDLPSRLAQALEFDAIDLSGAGIFSVFLIGVAWARLVFARMTYTAALPYFPRFFNRCPACGYDLTSSPDAGPCPECAHPYDKRQKPVPTSPEEA